MAKLKEEKLEDLFQYARSNKILISMASNLADYTAHRTPDCRSCFWQCFWDKPLYSNNRTTTASNWRKMLLAINPNASEDDLLMFFARKESLISPGPGNHWMNKWQLDESPELDGIPAWRTLAIVRLATRVLETKESPLSGVDFSDLRNFQTRVENIQSWLGPGWGHISVLHGLTDLGLACKPDIHLSRTINRIGLLDYVLPDGNPPLNQCIEVVLAVAKLADSKSIVKLIESILDINFGTQPFFWRIRFLDLLLMEMSRQGYIDGDDKSLDIDSDYDGGRCETHTLWSQPLAE